MYLFVLNRGWQTFLVLLVVYTAWVAPFELGFIKSPTGYLALADDIVNGCFAIDIVMTFFVAYLDKRSYVLIDDPKQIAIKYMFPFFFLDVLSTIPTGLISLLGKSGFGLYGLLQMLRLWRLRRVSSFFSR